MDAKTLAKVGLRILAVYFIAEGIVQVWAFLSLRIAWSSTTTFKHTSILIIFAVLSPALVGILLWLVAPAAGRWAAGREAHEKSAIPLNAQTLLDIGLIAIGVSLFCAAVIAALGSIYSTLASEQPRALLQDDYVLSQMVQAALGVALILGARFFTRLFYRLRQ